MAYHTEDLYAVGIYTHYKCRVWSK